MTDTQRLMDDAFAQARQAVMALERFTEGLHVARTAADLTAASSVLRIGQLYTEHLRCCWCAELDEIARRRVREIGHPAATNFDEPPF